MSATPPRATSPSQTSDTRLGTASSSPIQAMSAFFTGLMRKYLPDPFVLAICLTLLTFVLAIAIERVSPLAALQGWGKGFWGLLEFTTQMCMILACGYVLANAPIVDRFLDAVAAKVRTPRQAVVVATLVGGIGCLLNWGFGLVIGGVMARKLAVAVPGVHYPLIIAAAYSGFTLWGFGFSASIPLSIATPKHPLESKMGVVGLDQTIFSAHSMLTALAILLTLPLLNAAMHPKAGQPVTPIDPSLFDPTTADKLAVDLDDSSLAGRLNNSRVLSLLIGLIGLGFVVLTMAKGGSINLNLVNFLILFLGILALKTPAAYAGKLSEGAGTVAGILLQFPFYAGIMGIMESTGLVLTVSQWFVDFSTPQTLPFWGALSSFFINFFAPSGGGHWVIQGPFMVDAANQLGVSQAITAMSVQFGNNWNDLVQPFWILPALALSKLRLKDIMGYTTVAMLFMGVIYCVSILLWGFVG